jgi:hypothetical protein
VDAARTIELTIASLLKPRGYRKRARNWFRTSPEGDYQVVNLQKSSWGDENCYLNLGWDPGVPAGEFRPEHQCAARFRAEAADVILPFQWVRPDGLTTIELPGISLLDVETSAVMTEGPFAEKLADLVVVPIADFMDRTRSIVDLVPLLSRKPWYATVALRAELDHRGFKLPTSW